MLLVVTGAAGFIASKVAELLLADGHTVVGIDDMNDSYDVRLKKWRVDQIRNYPGFHFHKLSITDRGSMQSLLAGLDEKPAAIINLAARAGVRASIEDPWVYFETNVTGTLNLLELCREYGINKFVLASTSSLYGSGNKAPFWEDANTDSPLSPYAASKKGAEALCYSYHHLYDIDVTVLRYFTVYGPAGRPDMSPFRFVQWISEGRPVTIFGDGLQSRDFTYIDDIARGTIAGLKPVGYEIINLGSGTSTVLMDAIHLIENQTGNEATLEYKSRHPADVLNTWANIQKAKNLLGWKPEVSFTDGMQRLLNWYQENRDWAREIST